MREENTTPRTGLISLVVGTTLIYLLLAWAFPAWSSRQLVIMALLIEGANL